MLQKWQQTDKPSWTEQHHFFLSLLSSLLSYYLLISCVKSRWHTYPPQLQWYESISAVVTGFTCRFIFNITTIEPYSPLVIKIVCEESKRQIRSRSCRLCVVTVKISRPEKQRPLFFYTDEQLVLPTSFTHLFNLHSSNTYLYYQALFIIIIYSLLIETCCTTACVHKVKPGGCLWLEWNIIKENKPSRALRCSNFWGIYSAR